MAGSSVSAYGTSQNKNKVKMLIGCTQIFGGCNARCSFMPYGGTDSKNTCSKKETDTKDQRAPRDKLLPREGTKAPPNRVTDIGEELDCFFQQEWAPFEDTEQKPLAFIIAENGRFVNYFIKIILLLTQQVTFSLLLKF